MKYLAYLLIASYVNTLSASEPKILFEKNYKKRDQILNIKKEWHKNPNAILRFKSANLEQINELLKLKFISPGERQNGSPTTAEFANFLSKNPKARVHGYVVSPYRKDHRVTLEGIIIPGNEVTSKNKQAFLKFCNGADETNTVGKLWCWWD